MPAKQRLIRLALLLALAPAGPAQGPAGPSLKDQFRDPPREYSMEPLWSWNSALTREKLVWQIDQMVDKGVYGAYMHARDGLDQSRTPYFSEGFWEAVRISVEHAEKVGFRAWIYDEDKWPSGDAGGRTRAANPERFTATGLSIRLQDVTGPSKVRLNYPEAKFVIAARKTSSGALDPETLTDITAVNAVRGEWSAPAGEWRISILEPTPRPFPLPNYINPEAVREFIRNTYEQYAARFSRHFGKTIPGSFFDEIYNVVLAWDPILEERFRAHKGYELRPVLPLLFLDGGPRTIKVRCDYFDELTKLYAESWFQQLAEWCERHNLQLTGHTNEELWNIIDQGDYFRTWRLAQQPGTDNEDFRYTFPRVIGSWKPKQLSSLAHVYGKQRAMVEALGGAGWAITLEEARYGVNMLAAYGINSFVFHLFHYEMDTPESMDDWPNSWFYQNPYWKYFRSLADYVRRLSFMGSQGEHVAEIAVLYPVEEVWSQGVGRRLAPRPPAVELVDALQSEQLDCDLVDTDSLIRSLPTPGGRARIGKENYRVLILPDAATVSAAAYRRIGELAEHGLQVIAFGHIPVHSAEKGFEDPEVKAISAKLFPSGKNVFRGTDAVVKWLRSGPPPDVLLEGEDRKALRYYHRRVAGRDVYFFANGERRPVRVRASLAAAGGAERWDPETGKVEPLAVAGQQDGRTSLNLQFLPWEAYFVVLDPGAPVLRETAPRPPLRTVLAELPAKWQFQVIPAELDDRWTEDPGETILEIPVADFRLERRDGSLQPWRRVKLADNLNPRQGASRYLTAWDALWITRYHYDRNYPGELAGRELTFRREVKVPFPGGILELTIVADGAAECRWNGNLIGESAKPLAPIHISAPATGGSNQLEITVRGEGYLLAQGEVKGEREKVPIRTGKDWTVSGPGRPPLDAYEFAAPPAGKWGEPKLEGLPPLLPAHGRYRFTLPPGVRWMEVPRVRGEYELLLNGQPLPRPGSRIQLPGSPDSVRQLEVLVSLGHPEDGLLAPLKFGCGKGEVPSADWGALGLDWYSGRAVYSTAFRLSPEQQNSRLILELGDVRWHAEVWINGKLAAVRVWPPYEADITDFVKSGTNRLTVVVSNLLANRMRWDIFDAAVPRPVSRWWHDGNILREPGKLQSGLFGPVRIMEAGRR